MSRIGVICAMPSEIRPVVRQLGLRPAAVGTMRGYEGSVGGHDVVAVKMGIGTETAASTTEALLDATAVDHVAVVGIAGGVNADVPICLLVEPAEVLDWVTREVYRPTPIGGTTPSGRLATCNDMLEEEGDQDALVAASVVAVDMETASVAAVCQRRGVPWTAYRVVSDRIGETSAEVGSLAKADGSPDLPAALRYMARHPGQVPYLMRLGRNATRAANAAAAALRSALSA